MNHRELFELHPNYRDAMRNMGWVLLVLAFIQLTAWLLPSLPEFKGIPNYLPLHVFLESVSIIVSMMVFAAGWNSHSRELSGNIVLLACVSFSVGMLDFSHTISYGGMPDFISPNDAQKHLNFWLSARFLECLVLLVVAVRPSQKTVSTFNRNLILGSLILVTLMINWVVIFHQAWLPDTFIPGQGLTAFKKDTEYLIIAINATTAAILWLKMRKPQQLNVVLLFSAACTLAMSEFYFTLYTTMTGSYNVLGHVYKVIAYFFIYRAIVAEVIEIPYQQLAIMAEEQKAIINSDIVGIAKLKDRKFIWINSEFAEMLGYTKEEIIGQSTRMVYPNEDAYLAFAKAAYPVMQRNEIFRTEIGYRRKDGTLGWYEVSGGLLSMGSAESIWAFVDRTHRKTLEKQRDEAKKRYEDLLSNLQIGVIIQTPTSEIRFSNPRALSLLGLTENQLLGRTSFDADWKVIHEDGSPFPGPTHPVPQSISTRQPVHDVVMGVYRPVSQDISWILVNADPELNSDGTVLQVVCTFTDISERILANVALRQSEEQLAKAQSLARIGSWHVVFGIDAAQEVWTVSKELRKIWGLPEISEISTGQGFSEIPPEDQLRTQQIWESAKRGQGPNEWEHRIIVNGNIRWIHVVANFIFDSHGNPLEASGTNQDITDRKHAEQALRESEKRFRKMADSAPVLIWISGTDKLCFWFNKVWLAFTGRTMEQEMGNGWTDGVHPDDFSRCLEIYVSNFDQRKPFRMEYRLMHHSGEYRWIDDQGVPRFNDDGTFEGYIGSCSDIHISKNLNAERDRLLTILEDAPDFISTSDMEAHLKYLNPAGARLVGLPEDVDLTALKINDMHPDWATKRVLEEGVPTVLKQGFWTGETALLHRDGHETPVSQVLLLHRDQSGNPEFLSTIMRDITDRKAMEEQIQQLAFYDPLTKLPNRRLLSDRLIQVMSASRRSGIYGAIIFLDLDNFKPVNDIHGHAIGDLLLVEAAMRLKSCVREMDTVARFGGDEFVIMLSELDTDRNASISQAKRVAEKILALLSATYKFGIKSNEGYADRIVEHQCTASIGMAVFVSQQNSQEEIIGWADAAMYQAKESGRNQIRLYSEQV